MKKITIKTIEEIKSALAIAPAELSTQEVASLIGMKHSTILSNLRYHHEIKPERSYGASFVWTHEEVIRFATFISQNRRSRDKAIVSEPETPTAETATPETAIAEIVPSLESSISAIIKQNYGSPIDALIALNKALNNSPEVDALHNYRKQFENMEAKHLQIYFSEMLRRFKFSYITEIVKSVQSQTLTCIKNGTLKGIDKYELTFDAFLDLQRFCDMNGCPVNQVDIQ